MRKMANQVVSVERVKLAACMRCGICEKLLRDAMTVSECMHHFCSKCIWKKINVEELENCPVCGINLGADPLEKLRPDHNLRELRAKIFGSKRLEPLSTKVKPESLSESVVRRKERSLSLLGANAPKQRSEPVPTGKRMRHSTRSLRYVQSLNHLEKSNKKKDGFVDFQQRSSSSDYEHKSSEDNSDEEWHLINKTTDKIDRDVKVTPLHTPDDIWNPLNCLAEVVNKTEPVDSKIANAPDDEIQVPKSKMKDYGPKRSIDTNFQFTNPRKPRKSHSKNTPEVLVRIITSSVFSPDSSSQVPRKGPIWLQLLPSENQGTDMMMPQIPTSYLRIKDGSMTVSYIRKYITQKLNLHNQDEIEMACMGHSLSPAMPLTDVVSTWLYATDTPQKIKVTVGSSAKDFIMVLTYSKKALAPVPSPQPQPPAPSLSFLHL